MAGKTYVPASIYAQYISGESAYQTAIRVGKITSDVTEAEWIDSLYGTNGTNGADGIIQEIVAGTNVTVDNTDPARPVVSAAGGGGGGGVTLSSNQVPTNFYTGAAATLANLYVPRVDMNLVGLSCMLSGTAVGQQYKATALKVRNSDNRIFGRYDSAVLTLDADDSSVSLKNLLFTFTTPAPMLRSESATYSWFVGVTRVDGTATSPSNVGYLTTAPTKPWAGLVCGGRLDLAYKDFTLSNYANPLGFNTGSVPLDLFVTF